MLANTANISNIANMPKKTEPKRCMTTLPPEMVEMIPDVERATGGMSISEILKQGFLKVAIEIRTTGKLVIESMPTEGKQAA